MVAIVLILPDSYLVCYALDHPVLDCKVVFHVGKLFEELVNGCFEHVWLDVMSNVRVYLFLDNLSKHFLERCFFCGHVISYFYYFCALYLVRDFVSWLKKVLLQSH